MAHRLCARFQIHDRQRVRYLTPQQITDLGTFLSSPSTAPPVKPFLLADRHFKPPANAPPLSECLLGKGLKKDPLQNLKIESDLKREIRENIAHQRMIGSYVGRRHAMGLPVRGQNTRNNALTAKKLNRVDRIK